jgi:hypothetical protein
MAEGSARLPEWWRNRQRERAARREGYGAWGASAWQDKLFNMLLPLADGDLRVLSNAIHAAAMGGRTASLTNVIRILRERREGPIDG